MKNTLPILVILFVFSSCKSKYEKLLTSNNNNLKYEEGKKYYEQKEYDKAIELLENIRSFYIADVKFADINYTLADSHYNNDDIMLASYYYEFYHKNFSDSTSKKAMFMDAYCEYLMSPKYTLDQTNTKNAVDKFQRYINKYPDSEDHEEVNGYIKELRIKLEKKSFDISKLYFKHEDYRACNTSLDSFLEDFPDSKIIEDVYYYKVLSTYLYAENSIDNKKQEREELFKSSYDKMLKLFPESKYKKELDKLLD